VSVRTVYLINLSLGLAGIERRFTNIWRVLAARGRVRPVLVVPDTLASLLYRAKLATPEEDGLWTVPEPRALRVLSRLPLPRSTDEAAAFVRSRFVARRYAPIWKRILRDPGAVVHVGLNCSALEPPDVPVVYECVDSTLTQLDTRHYVKASARRCIVHCQTNRIRTALERAHAARRPNWTTVTSPCYFAAYRDEAGPPAPRDPRMVAFVGRFAPAKNPLLFIEAIGAVRDSGLDVRARMLGEGPQLADIQRRVRELGLDGVVTVGFSQSPIDQLEQSRVFVSLQTGDNYGSQSLLEAMGAGCAVVASDVGETRRLVTEDVGFVVDQTRDAVARAIGALVRDPRRAASMGAAAAYKARTFYSADTYVSFLEDLYEQAAGLHAAM
jgi:glycosyltransferase involved in cell wall biosynthesis